MIKLAILEDSKEIALSLQQVINRESDISCDHVYHKADDCLTFLPSTETDLLLIDIGLPDKSGIDVIHELKTVMPNLIFCVFTIYEDDEKVFNSIKAGARGYILKSHPIPKILEAIRELYAGGSPMSPSIARKVMDRVHFGESGSKKIENGVRLTNREIEILTLLSEGFLYKEIAHQLDISIGTVKQYIHEIYTKLEVSNKTEAINKINKTRGNH